VCATSHKMEQSHDNLFGQGISPPRPAHPYAASIVGPNCKPQTHNQPAIVSDIHVLHRKYRLDICRTTSVCCSRGKVVASRLVRLHREPQAFALLRHVSGEAFPVGGDGRPIFAPRSFLATIPQPMRTATRLTMAMVLRYPPQLQKVR
jgi:hypothetical protein